MSAWLVAGDESHFHRSDRSWLNKDRTVSPSLPVLEKRNVPEVWLCLYANGVEYQSPGLLAFELPWVTI